MANHDPFFSELKYFSCLKTGLRLRNIVNYVCNITPISKSKGKKTHFVSQFVQHFFRVFHLNFRMKRSAGWWSITLRRFMIPSRNLNFVMLLTWDVQVHLFAWRISKSKRRNLIFWVSINGISSVPVILTLEWNDLPDDELQLREDSWSLLGI